MMRYRRSYRRPHKSRFVEMFGDSVANEKRWAVFSLKDITTKIGSGATPKGGKSSYAGNGVSFIRSMNVHDGFFKYNDLAHLTQAQEEELSNVIVSENDVLLNITGASVARTCIVPSDVLPARVNQHVAILRADISRIDPVYLNRLLISHSFKQMLLNISESNGATRQAITKGQLERLDVPLPPLALQREFAAFVAKVDKLAFAVRKSLETAEKLYWQQLSEAFS